MFKAFNTTFISRHESRKLSRNTIKMHESIKLSRNTIKMHGINWSMQYICYYGIDLTKPFRA